MAVLQPGVTPSGYVAGSYQDANTYTLDGGNITDDMGGKRVSYQTNYSGLGGSQGGVIPSGVIPTPIESIEEFKVSVSNQTSDFNNSSGAQIQMATKRGSNQFHGSAYRWYFDTAIGAAQYLDQQPHAVQLRQRSLAGTRPIILEPPQPLRRRARRSADPQGFSGQESGTSSSTMKACGSPTPASVIRRTVPSALLRAGVIQVPNCGRSLPGLQPESQPGDGGRRYLPGGHVPGRRLRPARHRHQPHRQPDLEQT